MTQPFANMKPVNVIPPVAIKDNAALVSTVCDLANAGNAQSLVFVVQLGATDIALAVLKVMESDTLTNSTTLGGSPTTVVNVLSTVTVSATDDGKFIIIRVDLKAPRKRYVQLQATAGDGTAGTYVAAMAYFTNVGVPATDVGALAVIDA